MGVNAQVFSEFLDLCPLLQRALAHVHAYQVTPAKVTTRQRC